MSNFIVSSFNVIILIVWDSPHPSAPDQPPFETAVGFLQAPIDKLLDAFKDFPTAEMKKE